MQAVIRMVAKSIIITAAIALAIAWIGYTKKWDSSLAYSNAFFLAGALMIIAGGMSRLGAGQEWVVYQRLSAESFRNMSVNERANFILNASSPVNLVVLGLSSGILLIIISVIVARLS